MVFIYEVIMTDTEGVLTGLVSTNFQVDGSEGNALAKYLSELIAQDVGEKIPDVSFVLKDLRKVCP